MGRWRRGRVLGVSALAVTCGACGSGGRGIEDAAWTAAGVDDPSFTVVTTEQGEDLEVEVESSLPIEDANVPTRFADRVAQIVWRTHPGAFGDLTVTVVRDGEPVYEPQVYSASSLEGRLGPRPDGLDDGEARGDEAPAADGDLRAIVEAADDSNLAAVRDTLFVPLIETTVADHFESTATVESGEPDECLGGLDGTKPTGRFEVRDVAAVTEASAGTHLLPALVDYWRAEGLDVNTAVFDGGGNGVQVRLDDLGTLVATAGEDALTITALTDCLDPA